VAGDTKFASGKIRIDQKSFNSLAVEFLCYWKRPRFCRCSIRGDVPFSIPAPCEVFLNSFYPSKRSGADKLALKFETGGGRSAAAGINHLPESRLSDFVKAFREEF
jgi:hypothetical protein